jgi:hypothetical protein
MNIKDKNILILGTGQIGFAVFEELNRLECKKIVLHSYSEQEVLLLKEKVHLIKRDKTNVEYVFGDIYDSIETIKSQNDIINTNLYKICKQKGIDIIIDCINTAAVLGEQLASWNKEIKKNSIPSKELNTYEKVNNFIITLKETYSACNIDKYIKVSTTGLGGMGFNMGYTHGDAKSFYLSEDILGKLHIAGAFHQLLWALNRTSGYDISVIIPSACIGWQDVKIDTLPPFKKTESSKNISIEEINKRIVEYDIKDQIRITQVYLGENNSYSREEVALLTQLNQMEFVSKQRVAKIVIEELKSKSNNFNLLNAMDISMITPSYKDFYLRNLLINKMDYQNSFLEVESLVTNNLGRDVAIDIMELFIVKQLLNNSLENIHKCLEYGDLKLQQKIKQFFETNPIYRNYFLSLGFSILLDDEIWVASNFGEKTDYIDYRSENIIFLLNKVLETVTFFKRENTTFDYNHYFVDIINSNNISVGELLGMIYSYEGKGREVYYNKDLKNKSDIYTKKYIF